MHRIALISSCCITLLLASCGPADQQFTPVFVPSPARVVTTPPPDPSADAFPKDYLLTFLSPEDGIYTVPANSLSTPSLHSSVKPILSAIVYDGDWVNGKVVNYRPYSLVFLDGKEWKILSLRSGGAAIIQSTGIFENRPICTSSYIADVFQDYAKPENSVIRYQVEADDDSGLCQTTLLRLSDGRVINLDHQFPSFPDSYVFRDDTGALTGILAAVDSELRLYSTTSSGYVVAVSNMPTAKSTARNAGTNTTRLLLGGKGIYKIDHVGQATLLLDTAGSSIRFGIWHGQELFFSRGGSNSNTSDIFRLSLDGSVSKIATVEGGATIVAGSQTSIMLLQSGVARDANNKTHYQYSVLSKNGGTPVVVGTTDIVTSASLGAVATVDSGFLVNLTPRSADGASAETVTALTISESGQIIDSSPNSEWVAPVNVDPDYSIGGNPIVRLAIKVENFTGPYGEKGHEGGGIAFHNFVTHLRMASEKLAPAGIIDGGSYDYGDSMLAILSSANPIQDESDILGFDYDTASFQRLSSTAESNESIPR